MLVAIIAATVTGMAQSRTISGVVIDATNDEPLVGASVLPVGSSNGVATDMDGKFSLSVPASVKEVTVSYVGYTSVTLPVQDYMTIGLQPSATMLDQVVVTGYGSAKKLGSVVGSVSVVGEAALENTPATTFMDALQGQVPGLSIYSNSGDPSSNHNVVYMRGVSSLNADTEPLYILDGAPITSTVFTSLNPADIENITILKDAASVAIYGARAANGVIVITSKKGKFGEKAQVTIRANYGWSQLASNKTEMMDSKEYLKFRELIGVPMSDDALRAINDFGINTDWTDELFKSAAPTYSVEGVVRGGTENTNYYMSLAHYYQDGLIEHSEMHRETARWSLETKVNDWFRTGIQGAMGYNKYETNAESDAIYSGDGLYSSNPMVLSQWAFPYDSPYYYTVNEDGQPVWGERADYLHFSRKQMPHFGNGQKHSYTSRMNINANIFEQLNPIKGLTIRAQQSVDAYDQRRSHRYYPYESFVTPMGDKIGTNPVGEINPGNVTQSFGRYYKFTYTNTAEYRFDINNLHHIGALIGEESIITKSHSFGGSDSNHMDARLMLLGQGPQTTYSVSESKSREVFNSILFKADYNYDEKYFLDFTYRRDGSSKFAPDHRWANFVAIGAMWNIKAEKFLQPYTWLDDLKIRYNYGTTGNSGIGNYQFYALSGAGSQYAGNTSIGISSTAPGNPELTWETVYAHNLGLNFGFINRISGTVDFYTKETKNMLMAIPYSFTTGVTEAWGNVGSMRNRGFEVELNGDIYQSRDWYVGARVNFAYNENQITKLYDGRNYLDMPDYGMRWEVGHDCNEFWSVPFLGVDPQDGKQVWQDKNGNPTKVYSEDDRVLIGKSSMAPWTGGFGANARWKGLSLMVHFNWAAKKYMMNNDGYFNCNSQFATANNQVKQMLNIWTTPGQVTNIPAYGEERQHAGDDTSFLEDASFVRLKNLTLAYSLPSNLINKWGLSKVEFHFTGRNLLTFTDFTGYDPEPQSNYVQFQYPNTRQYELGVEVSF